MLKNKSHYNYKYKFKIIFTREIKLNLEIWKI